MIKTTITLGPSKENEKILALSDQKMKTKAEEWSKNLDKKSSPKLGVENIDHTQKF